MDFETGTLILTALAVVMAPGMTVWAGIVVYDYWRSRR